MKINKSITISKVIIFSVITGISSLNFLYAAESECILEFRNSYKKFISALLEKNSPKQGAYIVMGMEKNYRNGRKSDRDSIKYIISPPKRIKIYNDKFALYSDGNIYIMVFPAMKKIAIQKIISKTKTDDLNPIELMKKAMEVMISKENFQSCKEIISSTKIHCKELILKPSVKDSKNSAVENMSLVMDMNDKSLVSIRTTYKKIVDISDEKYVIITFSPNYTLPWDLVCPIDNIIFEHGSIPKKEYKNYKIVDMRKK